ncbi:MAG: hypothetical protein JNM39_14100 [Bdellovibrionaceae bacterium]|nr:hypothetical protein [Pseudobdellovibrionaceae bacterium]
MKKNLFILILAGLAHNSFAQSAPNSCKETQMSISAKTMNLAGDVIFKSSQGPTAEMTASLVTESSAPQAFQKMTELAQEKNQTMVSPIFSIGPAGALVVVQDPRTCTMTVFGFDGIALGIHKVIEIKEDSLTYLFPKNERITVARKQF